MKYSTRNITWLFLLFPFLFFGQIRISDHIQASDIAGNENSLYFVDFWATWCGPCIHVSKYLSTLQERFPDDLHIMSLTKENPDLVKRFMEKHPSNLAVAIDYNGETFNKYKIKSLPHGILFNAQGKKLWEGHPANFKAKDVQYFLKKNRKKLAVDIMYPLQEIEQVVKRDEELTKDFEMTKIPASPINFQIVKKANYIELTGSLQKLLAYAQNVYKDQIKISKDLNSHYRIRMKPNLTNTDRFADIILSSIGLQSQRALQKGEVLLFSVKNANFWDTDQIDWGNDTPNFLVGDSDIKADNVSLHQVAFQLSELLQVPILVQDTPEASTLHDWNIHYQFYQLMTSDLYDNYGIEVEKKVTAYPIYHIKKKHLN